MISTCGLPTPEALGGAVAMHLLDPSDPACHLLYISDKLLLWPRTYCSRLFWLASESLLLLLLVASYSHFWHLRAGLLGVVLGWVGHPWFACNNWICVSANRAEVKGCWSFYGKSSAYAQIIIFDKHMIHALEGCTLIFFFVLQI